MSTQIQDIIAHSRIAVAAAVLFTLTFIISAPVFARVVNQDSQLASNDIYTQIGDDIELEKHAISQELIVVKNIVLVDFDGDGDIDVIGQGAKDIYPDEPDILWWENIGHQQFLRRVLVDNPRVSYSAKVGDLDGDGDPDIVVSWREAAHQTPQYVSWFENDGSGTLTERFIANGSSYSFDIVDLDTDGDTDVLVCKGSAISWLENDGNQDFTWHTTSDISYFCGWIYPEDIDSDGDMDFIASSYWFEGVAWFENDGNQIFERHQLGGALYVYPEGWDGFQIYASDLDQDGDIDIIGGHNPGSILIWWENDGYQTFGQESRHNIDVVGGEYQYVLATLFGVRTADLDSDNDLDIIAVGRDTRTLIPDVAWYENDGNQTFQRHVLATDYERAESLEVADMDGDGDIDIVVGGHEVAWWENKLIDNLPPILDELDEYATEEGESVTLNANAIDPNGHELVYEWDLDGDGIFETPGQTIADFAQDVNGPRELIVSVRVCDSLGACDTDSTTVTVSNVRPSLVVSAIESEVDEGEIASANGIFADPIDDVVVTASVGTVVRDSGRSGEWEWSFGSSDGPDESQTVAITATDSDGAASSTTFNLIVNNVAPTIDSLVGPVDPVSIDDQPISVEVTFSDPGIADTHNVTWNWGDGSNPDTQIDVTSPASQGHTYAEAGVYSVQVTVTDDDRESASATYEYIVIFNTEGGFVTGGGWIHSEAGWCQLDEICLGAEGKANFGFVSKYKKKDTEPTGNTEFNFKAGGLVFHSSTYDWLVINQGGKNAQYKGSGLINHELAPTGEEYRFMIWAKDLDPDDDDTFRIKIWYDDGGDEVVVYDNGFNQAIGGGNITIHAD